MKPIYFITLFLLCLPSCGTIINIQEKGLFFPVGQKVANPYGGVIIDGMITATPFLTGEPFLGFFTILGIVDLPFSLVGDTVTLPYTIPRFLSHQEEEDEPKTRTYNFGILK